jgi:hypothetical protein
MLFKEIIAVDCSANVFCVGKMCGVCLSEQAVSMAANVFKGFIVVTN